MTRRPAWTRGASASAASRAMFATATSARRPRRGRRLRAATFGCGSGVVAIAAAKLGFGPVLALDVDPAAVEVARVNAAANGVDVDVRLEDVVCVPPPRADVAVANIALDAAEALAPRVRAGRLVTSGYLARDRVRFHGWKELEHRHADGWGAHVFAREGE